MEDNFSLHEKEIKAHLLSNELCCFLKFKDFRSDSPQKAGVRDQEQGALIQACSHQQHSAPSFCSLMYLCEIAGFLKTILQAFVDYFIFEEQNIYRLPSGKGVVLESKILAQIPARY